MAKSNSRDREIVQEYRFMYVFENSQPLLLSMIHIYELYFWKKKILALVHESRQSSKIATNVHVFKNKRNTIAACVY